MNKQVAVTDISDLPVNQRVTVVAKLINTPSPQEITMDDKTHSMQNCQIAVAYGHCRVVLWQEHLIEFAEGECYEIKHCNSIFIQWLSASGFHTSQMIFLMKINQ